MTLEVNSDELEAASQVAWNAHQRRTVLHECKQIVSHRAFSKSKRCITLFQYLVEHSLACDHEALKERILGIEVFGRSADYDTNADPVVRMTANEIRKRLAQYYQEKDGTEDIRIHLFPGSYRLQFEVLSEAAPTLTTEQNVLTSGEAPAHQPLTEGTPAPRTRHKFIVSPWLLTISVVAAILLATVLIRSFLTLRPPSTQALIWSPFIQRDVPVLVSVSDSDAKPTRTSWTSIAQVISTGRVPETLPESSPFPTVPFVDALAATQVIASLGTRRQPAVMEGTSNVTLDGLRHGSDILIGGFDNPWALVLTSHLRFHLMVDPATQVEWIGDSRHPERKQWKLSIRNLTFMNATSDYALITRYHSPDTGTWILVIEGLGLQGTEAGSQLLTNPKMDQMLPLSLRNTQKNFQLVIKSTVINGNTSPPQILATYVWPAVAH